MSVVYFCHNIDAEGPLALEHVRQEELPKSYPHKKVNFSRCKYQELVAGHRSKTLGSWTAIYDMLVRGLDRRFREKHHDSYGNKWICNWFCMDHINFIRNPRHRAMGLHTVFDFYNKLLAEQDFGDSIQWHFHPHNLYSEGHRCSVSYVNSPELYTILGHRVIDHKWFPQANRPGCQDERQDANWFLEQWIPFDFANAGGDMSILDGNEDLKYGRVSDWRFAPSDWRTYHPHHDCVQLEGNCRRKIAQSASLLNRFAPLTEEKLYRAFDRANAGISTLVGLESHDWRDLTLEIEYFFWLLQKVKKHFPNVPYRFGTAVDCFNAVHPPKAIEPVKLDCHLHFDDKGLPHQIRVAVKKGKTFGPQPFLVIRTRSKNIVHDSMDFWNSLNDYCYTFDNDRVNAFDVEAIGIATNDDAGFQSIHVLKLDQFCPQPSSVINF